MHAGRVMLLGALLAAACGGSATTTPGAGAGGGGQNAAAGDAGRNASGASTGATSGGATGGSASGGGGGAAPAMFIDQIRVGAGCLPLVLPVDTNPASPTFGQVLCQIVEVPTGSCDCTKPGRTPLDDPSLVTSIRQKLQATGNCGDGSGQTPCDSFCMCDIVQEIGAALAACQTDSVAAATDSGSPPGFCYASDPASPALARCPSNEKQKLVFVSSVANPTPTPTSIDFLTCSNALLP